LIANRDEYLRHSSQNYTLQQKQYNNWLTERLIEVANENHYEFDPEEFNFVAIRDRIRCYYKSYVQTARKRGLHLPANVKPTSKSKKTKASRNGDEEDDDGEEMEADDSAAVDRKADEADGEENVVQNEEEEQVHEGPSDEKQPHEGILQDAQGQKKAEKEDKQDPHDG